MKKNDKIIILLGILLGFCVLSWFIDNGSFTDGIFTSSGIASAGIFDYFLFIFQAFITKAPEIIYLFVIGGFYGVITKTVAYRKLVSKTSLLIKGKEYIALLVITLISALYMSIAKSYFPLLFVAPFIITVFLRRGCDRLTALSAAFGGIFIGVFGQTFGTYLSAQLLEITSISAGSGILIKIALFVGAYILYNLFAIIHMNTHVKSSEYVKFDMFPIIKVDESRVPKSLRKHVWPLIVLLVLALIVAMLGYIDWNTSFSVKIFDNLLTKIKDLELFGKPVLYSFLGNFTSFGNWDALNMSFILVILSLIIGFADKMSISDMCASFGDGIKKISRVAFVLLLVNAIYIAYYYTNWPVSILSKILNLDVFNFFRLFIGSVFNSALAVEFEFSSYNFASVISSIYVDNVLDSVLIVHFGYSLVYLLAPTSATLMVALSYLNIPYSKWWKYIWKFALSIFIVGMIALLLFVIV